MKRVVITGMGAYTCFGKNPEEVKESPYPGRSGIGIEEIRKEIGYRSPLTGLVERPQLKGMIDRRLRVGLAEEAEYAYASTVEALENAKIDMDFLEKNEVGILFGNDSSAKAVIEANNIIMEKRDTALLGSGAIFQSMNSTVTVNLAVIFKLRGINMTISAACASGSHSIGLGYFFIKHGLQKTIICGGTQETNYYYMESFHSLAAFSVRIDEPKKASRPFDKNLDGLVSSGGAATVVPEEYEQAVKKGAPILGEIVGYGFSSNGGQISQPSNEGSFRAMKMALDYANVKPSEIDYINAHATSTPLGDQYEAQATHQLFGKYKPPVSSTKSMTGQECWMAGASEIVYSNLMMRDNFIALNINFEEGDEHSSKLNIISKTEHKVINIYLSNSFGFGGTNSALVVKKN